MEGQYGEHLEQMQRTKAEREKLESTNEEITKNVSCRVSLQCGDCFVRFCPNRHDSSPFYCVLYISQYNFQHSELASKKEKLDRAQDKRKADANERHLTMSRNRDDLRKLREASREGSSQCQFHMTVASKLKKLEEICDIDGGKEFLVKLSVDGLLSVVKDRKLEELNEIEQGNAALRMIIAGYQNALGSSSLFDGGDVPVMEQ